jgi:hypothetical protein
LNLLENIDLIKTQEKNCVFSPIKNGIEKTHFDGKIFG